MNESNRRRRSRGGGGKREGKVHLIEDDLSSDELMIVKWRKTCFGRVEEEKWKRKEMKKIVPSYQQGKGNRY